MISGFQEGYEYFRKHSVAFLGAMDGSSFGLDRAMYVDSVEKEIEKLEQDLNAFMGFKTPNPQLKGDIAEFWHSGTYNINAAMNRSANRMQVDRSHDFASPDVTGATGDVEGMQVGLKYYWNGEQSAKMQAVSVFQRFQEYKAKGGKDDLEKYLADRNYSDIEYVLNDPIYSGQIRVIPSDQLTEATQWLEKMIAKESARRPEQVARYKETLQMLRDKISDSQGNESVALSKAEAEALAGIAKEGKFDASEYGFTAPELLNLEMVMKESMKAGVNAAIISLVLQVGPELYKAIDYLIKNGEIQEEQFKKLGFAAVTGASEGFIRGSVASAITACCKSGVLGETLKEVDPTLVSTIVVLTMNVIKGSYGVAVGKKTRTELANDVIRDVFVSSASVIGGSISQAYIEIPVLGYMIGSFVGSVVGSFIYENAYKQALTFCVDTGFTFFGLVEQDYTLPEDVIEQMGIETFEYETFELNNFKADTFEFDTFLFETIEPEEIAVKPLRRGVINVSKIGYLS